MSARSEIPQVVIERLPQYLRALAQLQATGEEVISSQQLGHLLQVTPAQIRKDLSYFGRFGKQGRGYSITELVTRLRDILGLNHTWNVAVIGVGRLGRAIISYPGFEPEGFRIVCAFDADQRLAGQMAGGLMIHHMPHFKEIARRDNVRIAIVAVPASVTQEVVNYVAESGVKAILNYAPVSIHAPRGVYVRNVDPVIALQSMTFYLEETA